MERLLFDFRLALRRLRKHPAYAATVILCLALGIGANTAIFSVTNSLLFKPLPGIEIDSLLFVHQLREGFDPYEGAYLDYQAVRSAPETFELAGLSQRRSVHLTDGEEPERIEGARVTWDYLAALDIQPLHGRTFLADEDSPGADPVLILGYNLWQRRFAGDPSIVDRTLRIEDRVYTVIGVMPQGFDMPLGTEIWMPMATDFNALPLREQASQDYLMVAKMAPGISFESARGRIDALNQQLLDRHPEIRRGWETRIIPLRRQLLHDINGELEPRMLLLLSVVALLLLITCANVASLLLVRALYRTRELSLKTALGAQRGRLVSEVLVESLVLALAGGLAGLFLAAVVAPPMMALSPIDAFAYGEVFATLEIDGAVLAYTLGLSLFTGLLFGLVPALRAAGRQDLVTDLREGGRGSGGVGERRLLGGLVVAEIAIAVALLLGAAVMVTSFQSLQATDLGFEPEDRLVVEMFLSSADYPDHPRRVAFAEELLDRVRTLPGVEAAATTTTIPLHHDAWDAAYLVEGSPPEDPNKVPTGTFRVVTPGFFETAGIELQKGRLLSEEDRAGGLPVVVITEEFAREAFPGQDPLGQRLKLASRPPEETPWWSVVGVVENVKEDPFNFYIDRPAWYFPYAQLETGLPLNLLIHTAGDPQALVGSVRQAIREIAPRQPLSSVVTLESHVNTFLGPNRFGALLISLFAVAGLVLSAVGLYGLMSFIVARQVRQIGIRRALGAQRGDLMRLILGRGLRLTLLGLVLGLVLGLILNRFLSGLLYQVEGVGAGSFLVVAAVLLAVAVGALYLPARRATRIDPMHALREE